MHVRTHPRIYSNLGLAYPCSRHYVQHTSRHCRSLSLHRPRPDDRRPISMPESGNGLVSNVVTILTESLRMLGIGQEQYERIAQQVPTNTPLAPGDIEGMIERISQDYERAYFVTGVIDDSIYDTQCTFADPTVKFSGLQLWKRNLQLLVPFLVNPSIQLLSINPVNADEKDVQQIQAEWQLQTALALPWRPFINVIGRTVYTLNATANKVVLHVETWNISPVQALQQVFSPGRPKQ